METLKKVQTAVRPVILCALLFFLDQLTKYAALTGLKGQGERPVLGHIFVLQYVENRGAAFGILQNRQWIFIAGAAAAVLLVSILYSRIPQKRKYIPLRACAILIVSGALGNLYDRMTRQFVVDFFYFKWIDFPVFNVADCYVVVACVLFAILLLFFYREEDLRFAAHR